MKRSDYVTSVLFLVASAALGIWGAWIAVSSALVTFLAK